MIPNGGTEQKKISPYVKVMLHDYGNKKQCFETNAIDDNGFNPI